MVEKIVKDAIINDIQALEGKYGDKKPSSLQMLGIIGNLIKKYGAKAVADVLDEEGV